MAGPATHNLSLVWYFWHSLTHSGELNRSVMTSGGDKRIHKTVDVYGGLGVIVRGREQQMMGWERGRRRENGEGWEWRRGHSGGGRSWEGGWPGEGGRGRGVRIEGRHQLDHQWYPRRPVCDVTLPCLTAGFLYPSEKRGKWMLKVNKHCSMDSFTLPETPDDVAAAQHVRFHPGRGSRQTAPPGTPENVTSRRSPPLPAALQSTGKSKRCDVTPPLLHSWSCAGRNANTTGVCSL